MSQQFQLGTPNKDFLREALVKVPAQDSIKLCPKLAIVPAQDSNKDFPSETLLKIPV